MTRRTVTVLAALGAAACAVPPAGDGGGAGEAPASPPVEAGEVTATPMRALAHRVDDHLVNYGAWTDAEIELAHAHDLVILDPDERDLDRATIEAIQTGGPERVLVVCYISVGEDRRTAGMTDEEMAADPDFVGDGTGPRVDPRGPLVAGGPLTGIDPLGDPSPGGGGFASYYLDDVSVWNDPDHVGDGRPDRNGNFGGAFTNLGDPAWFEALDEMTYADDKVSGLRELLTTWHGRGLGCDGVFLDTIDTAAPNRWTDASSSNETKYEWTAPGYGLFLERLRAAYPDAVVVQNRGLFFFNPLLPQFDFIPRGNLDFVVYESYRLNSGTYDNPDPYHYPNNRYNYAPKLMAEANREDGFRVLSIGYAEGPPDEMSQLTLIGESTLGYESLLEDIRVTERLAGFRHYLTDASLVLVNTFVADHADRSDLEPPAWTSTYDDNWEGSAPPGEPTPRVGIQEVVPGDGALTVRWDVAQDLNRVGYALYYQPAPFDFDADPELDGATRVVLSPRPTEAYAGGIGPGIYANEATVTGLEPGTTYHLVIRAFDDSAAANEDDNQVVLTGTPTGDATGSYLGRLRASNGVDSLTYRMQHTGEWTWRRVYVDRDRMTGTGWRAYGIGADYLLENGRLYRYTGDGASWSWSYQRRVTLTTGDADGMRFARWDLDQDDLGAGDRRTRLVFQLQVPGDVVTSAPYEHVYTTSDPASPYLGYYVENDGSRIYFHAEVQEPFAYRHIFIDDDADAATGYAIGGVGAGYMIENGRLYRHDGAGWSWSRVGDAGETIAGTSHDWAIDRAAVGLAGGAPRIEVVFQANGGPPSFVAPVVEHRFTP